MMMEMISLFKWTLVASLLSASVLSFIGVQLSSKAKSVQVLSMSQGAILGVLLGMAASGSLMHSASEFETHFLPPSFLINYGFCRISFGRIYYEKSFFFKKHLLRSHF